MVTSNFFYIVILDEQIEGNVGYLKDRTVKSFAIPIKTISSFLRLIFIHFTL